MTISLLIGCIGAACAFGKVQFPLVTAEQAAAIVMFYQSASSETAAYYAARIDHGGDPIPMDSLRATWGCGLAGPDPTTPNVQTAIAIPCGAETRAR